MAVITDKEKISLIESAFGQCTLSSSGKNVSTCCPECGKTKSLNKRKLSISLETGIYHCWVCEIKGKNIAYLAKKFRAYDNVLEGLYQCFGKINIKNIEEKEEIVTLPKDYKLLCIDDSRQSKIAKNYLFKRGLDYSDIVKYKVGISNNNDFNNRIIFPSFNSDLSLNFYIARSYDKNTKRAYRNSKFSKKEIIFNENMINWSKRIILVEGVFDAIKAGDNAVCMLGSWIDESHKLFKEIVKNNTPVILALDPDAREKAQKIAKKLIFANSLKNRL